MSGCFPCLKKRNSDSYKPVEPPPPSSDPHSTLSPNHNKNGQTSDHDAHISYGLRGDDLTSLRSRDTLNIASDPLAKGDNPVGEQASRINFLLSDEDPSVAGDSHQSVEATLQVVHCLKQQATLLKKEGGSNSLLMSDLEALVRRLEVVTSKLEKVAGSESSAPAIASAPWLDAYNALVSGVVSEFLALSNSIGDDVAAQADLVKKAFDEQQRFLTAVNGHSSPPQSELPSMLKSQADAISAVVAFKDNKRGSKFFDHLSAVAEGISFLGWVSVTPTPAPFVKDGVESAQFYTNRVIKQYKGKDDKHLDWARKWITLGNDLAAYVKSHHTTGLSWTPTGPKFSSQASAAPPAPPAPSGGAPPPPPPPPPAALLEVKPTSGGVDARAALFADLNKGENVTSGLRKVTDDMKTHKNPNLRKTAVVAAGDSKKPPPISPKPGRKPVTKPPVLELVDKKWNIANHVGRSDIVISETERKQAVYIFKCKECTIQVKGKINSIVMDSCEKTGLAFDDLIAGLDIVNCQRVQAQVMGTVRTINIDKTDGCQIYLSKASIDADIVTAKSSEMNISVPTDDGDFTEYPLPEQFKTCLVDGKLKTVVADN